MHETKNASLISTCCVACGALCNSTIEYDMQVLNCGWCHPVQTSVILSNLSIFDLLLMYQLFKQTKTSIAVHIISISKSNSIYRTMTKNIQFHNLFFFCVSSVTDSFNRVILHKERFIDSVKVNVRKKKKHGRPYCTYQHGEGVVSSAWVPVQTPRYCSVSG